MRKLTKEQVLSLHQDLIKAYGGSDGIRDNSLLESALATPFQSFGGEVMFPGVQRKAARLCFGLIKNHPFVDGNKRIGTHAMITMLAMNDIELEYTQKELYEVILEIASSKIDYEDLLKWVLDHEL